MLMYPVERWCCTPQAAHALPFLSSPLWLNDETVRRLQCCPADLRRLPWGGRKQGIARRASEEEASRTYRHPYDSPTSHPAERSEAKATIPNADGSLTDVVLPNIQDVSMTAGILFLRGGRRSVHDFRWRSTPSAAKLAPSPDTEISGDRKLLSKMTITLRPSSHIQDAET